MEKKKYLTRALALILVLSIALCSCGNKPEEPEPPVEDDPPGDVTPPVISGTADASYYIGDTISYRLGVSAVDETDGEVPFTIDASAVDISVPGVYPVVYSAVDAAGNQANVTIKVTIEEPENDDEQEQAPEKPGKVDLLHMDINPTLEELYPTADEILAKITKKSMTQTEMASAIRKYVYSHVRYVGSSDKSNYLKGAYIGFNYGKGDCFTFYACTKVLLDRAGIKNITLRRVNGRTKHFWNLVYLDGGWYHLDSCWAPAGHPHPNSGFMMTEEAVRKFTKEVIPTGKTNYYTYDYTILENLGIVVQGTPLDKYGYPIVNPDREYQLAYLEDQARKAEEEQNNTNPAVASDPGNNQEQPAENSNTQPSENSNTQPVDNNTGNGGENPQPAENNPGPDNGGQQTEGGNN